MQVSNLELELRKASDEITRLREELSSATRENIQLKVCLVLDVRRIDLLLLLLFFLTPLPFFFRRKKDCG